MPIAHDDRESILREIDRSIEDQRDRLRSKIAEYAAGSSGARLPLIVNGVLAVTTIVAVLFLRGSFISNQEEYVLRASAGEGLGADIVAALLAETENALSEKEAAIGRLREDLATVDARLAELEEAIESQLVLLRAALESESRDADEIDALVASERVVLEAEYAEERGELLARRASITGELEDRIREQETLLAQVATQRQILSEGGEEIDPGQAELNELAQRQRVEELFQQRVLSGYRSFSSAADARAWGAALMALTDLEQFLVSGDVATGDAGVRQTHLALVTNLATLVRVADEGWSEDATEDVLPGWSSVRDQITVAQRAAASGDLTRAAELYEAAITQIPGVGSGVGLIAQRAEERSISAVSRAVERAERMDGSGDPQAVLSVLTEELDRADQDVPIAVRGLTERLQEALAAVERQKQDLETITNLSQQQLALLRESVAGTEEGSTAVPVDESAEGIAAEIELLQTRVTESRARQEAMQAEIGALTSVADSLRTELAGREADQSRLEEFYGRVSALSRRYQQRTAGVRSDVPTDDRQLVRAALNLVLDSMDGATANDLFPDQTVLLRVLTDALISLEGARAAAAAEERLLAEVQRATERISEEQVRLLEFSDNADRDTATLLTSLVEEIDTLAQARREDLQASDLVQALGVIVRAETGTGTLLVQRVAALETRRAQRIFVNRELPNGDRIPIADVEVVAVSGENTIIRVVSTIAPTITPQVNDVVYVEF